MALPFATALACTLLGVVAWPLPWLGPIAPPLALMAVYYWAVHRPDLFRPGMAFVIGLINDVVNYLPLGVSALLFVALHQVVLRRRRFFAGHSFLMLWCGFALAVLAVQLAAWVLITLVQWRAAPAMPLAMQTALAILVFPFPCWLLIRVQRFALAHN